MHWAIYDRLARRHEALTGKFLYIFGSWVDGSAVISPLNMSASASALRQDSDRQTNRQIAG